MNFPITFPSQLQGLVNALEAFLEIFDNANHKTVNLLLVTKIDKICKLQTFQLLKLNQANL